MKFQTPNQYYFTKDRQISPTQYNRKNINSTNRKLVTKNNMLTYRNKTQETNQSFTSYYPHYQKNKLKNLLTPNSKIPLQTEIKNSPQKLKLYNDESIDTKNTEILQNLKLKQINSTKNTKVQKITSLRNNFAFDYSTINRDNRDYSNKEFRYVKHINDTRDRSIKKIEINQEIVNESPLLKILQTRRFKKPKVSNPVAQMLNLKLKNLQYRIDETKDPNQEKKYLRQHSNSKAKHLERETIQKLKFQTYINQLTNYDYLSELGQGGYARVILAKNIYTRINYAVKIYDKLKLQSKSKISNIKREISIMQTLQHQNISAFHEFFENKTTVYIVMQYCGNYSLYAYINSFENCIVPEKKAKYIFSKVASAIMYMKQKKIAHRDIKAQNILIINESIKLIDFGFSIFTECNQKIATYCGTPTYMSPQIVSRQPYDAFCSDVWSLGVLLFLMLQGSYPFSSTNQDILFEKIKIGKYKYDYHISEEAKQIIDMMLVVNTEKRMQIQDIIKNEWLQKK